MPPHAAISRSTDRVFELAAKTTASEVSF